MPALRSIAVSVEEVEAGVFEWVLLELVRGGGSNTKRRVALCKQTLSDLRKCQ